MERIWIDGDYLVGVMDEYVEIVISDLYVFFVLVVGGLMVLRFNFGEFVFVEFGMELEIEDDVFVCLVMGEMMLKWLFF